MYNDRARAGGIFNSQRRGGRGTRCAVDLRDVSIHGDKVLYKGQPPDADSSIVGQGAYGEVYKLFYTQRGRGRRSRQWPDKSWKSTGRAPKAVATLIVKIQDLTGEAARNLEAARALKECALVDFKSVKVDGKLWTIMESMDHDAAGTNFKRRQATTDAYASFLERLRRCLFESGASFTDMKLQNTGVKECEGRDVWRLLDLDGVNTRVSTYPMYSGGMPSTPAEKMQQTIYAFAVTAMLYEQVNPIAAGVPFYWNNLEPLETRVRLLTAHMETTRSAPVRRLIADALAAIEGKTGRRLPEPAMSANRYTDWI